jgi:hypothetical protein
MNKEFVPYEESLALKELGFDEECLKYWNDFGKTSTYMRFQLLNDIDDWCQDYIKAPLYSQAFRWFRENHDLIHRINRDGGWWICAILDLYDEDDQGVIENFIDCNPKTYEEAELACLKKLIEKIK